MLDQAFEALKTFDWGADPKALKPIDEAVASTYGDARARTELESRLLAILSSDAPRPAKEFVCRSLKIIGTAACVPALAKLLGDAGLSHMARFALQAVPGPEATQALVAALEKAPKEIKIGIVSSLGARAASGQAPVAALAPILADSDAALARSGALALGQTGSPEAAKILVSATGADSVTKSAIADALLACAENLANSGKKAEAKATYEKILEAAPSESVKVAAALGIKATS